MNLNQTFNILFWLHKSCIDKKGTAPIWVRITIDGRRAECSTLRKINPEHWDSTYGQAKPACHDASIINEYLLVTCIGTLTGEILVQVKLLPVSTPFT